MQIVDLIDVRLNERKIHMVDALKKYRADPSIYITFSDLAKVGINPQSSYDTPLGIYTYPLDAIWDQLMFNALPFGTERPFVHVLKAHGNLLDLKTYSSADMKRDLEKLRPIFLHSRSALKHDTAVRDKIAQGWYGFSYSNSTDEHKAKIDKFISDQKEQLWGLRIEEGIHSAFVATPGGWIWNITRLIATSLAAGGSKAMVLWNAIFRLLGYDGAVDRDGQGIIHHNEPTQAVFFSKLPLTHLATVANTYDRPIDMSDRQARFGNYEEFLGWLAEAEYAKHDEETKQPHRSDHWLAYLKQQWTQLLSTGESENFKLGVTPEEFYREMIAEPERMIRSMLRAGQGIFYPIIVTEIMKHPELQTPHLWQVFLNNVDTTRGKLLQLLLMPSVVKLHAEIKQLSYAEAWQTLSDKVIWHLLDRQQMRDLVLNSSYGSSRRLDQNPAMTEAKRLIKPLQRLLAPQSYSDEALNKALEDIQNSDESPF